MTTYIQQNTIVKYPEDGIAIEDNYSLYNKQDPYEFHGMHYVDNISLNIISADMVIIEKGNIICRGDITDLEPIELFLTNNIGLL